MSHCLVDKECTGDSGGCKCICTACVKANQKTHTLKKEPQKYPKMQSTSRQGSFFSDFVESVDFDFEHIPVKSPVKQSRPDPIRTDTPPKIDSWRTSPREVKSESTTPFVPSPRVMTPVKEFYPSPTKNQTIQHPESEEESDEEQEMINSIPMRSESEKERDWKMFQKKARELEIESDLARNMDKLNRDLLYKEDLIKNLKVEFENLESKWEAKSSEDVKTITALANQLQAKEDLIKRITVRVSHELTVRDETIKKLTEEIEKSKLDGMGKNQGVREDVQVIQSSSNVISDKDPSENGKTIPSPIPFEKLRFLDVIGQGSFGKVYKGIFSGTFVAIKEILQSKDEVWESSSNEITFLMKANHPCIIHCYGWTWKDSKTYIVLDLMKFGLDDLLWGKKKGQLTTQQKVQILIQIANGMACIHENRMIHRDLKSLNILLDDSWNAKICDFGCALLKKDSKSFYESTQKGTTAWMAPELFEDVPSYSMASDSFAFGMIIYEFLEECAPWAGLNQHIVPMKILQGNRPTLKSFNASDPVNLTLKDIMIKCWDQNPKERLTMDEICAKLEKLTI